MMELQAQCAMLQSSLKEARDELQRQKSKEEEHIQLITQHNLKVELKLWGNDFGGTYLQPLGYSSLYCTQICQTKEFLCDALNCASNLCFGSLSQAIGGCPMGFAWIKCTGGWQCAGGSHFVSESDLQNQFGVHGKR